MSVAEGSHLGLAAKRGGPAGAIYYWSEAPVEGTADGEEITAWSLSGGKEKTIYRATKAYSPDMHVPRVVGFLSKTEEVVLGVRRAVENVMVLLARNQMGEDRELARFPGQRIVIGMGYGDVVGLVLRPWEAHSELGVAGRQAVLVRTDGSVVTLVDAGEVAGDATCTRSQECYVPLSGGTCVSGECDPLILKFSKGKKGELLTIRGSGVSVSPDGRFLVAASVSEGRAHNRMYDLVAGRWTVDLGKNPVGTPVWSPDGRFVANLTGGGPPDWVLQVWDTHGKRVAKHVVPYKSFLVAWVGANE